MGGSPIWEELETMELLDIWRQARLQSALRTNVRNKWIWEHVADQLWHRGFVRSGEQCKNKVHNLLCVYRNVCRGRLPRWRCRYFDLLHRVASAKDVSDLEEPSEVAEKSRPLQRLSEPADLSPPPVRSGQTAAGSERSRARTAPDTGRVGYGAEEGRLGTAAGDRPGFERVRCRSEGQPEPSPGARCGSEEGGLSPPAGRQRARRDPPALVPIAHRPVPAAGAGLPLCSEEVRVLLARLWGQRLQAELLQRVRQTGGLKALRDGALRSQPYPTVRPPPARDPAAPHRNIITVTAPTAGGGGAAPDQPGTVIAQVPLLPSFRERTFSVSPGADQPVKEVSGRRLSPPAASHDLLAGAWDRCGASGRSAEALRGLSSRGLVLLPGGHGPRGVTAVGGGVIRVDID
ncbi:Zinc finger and SCAN domain-containing protein 29 [Amphibalanus amphitrite]|uniref:Zinc finger and SCAN domain-containing protein 29 n=1 Tax=Amphibalanus amphitrite TaxID=1232801 RepID=A0A6A4WVU0_AMPAM|nr:Zinc finger and SCAN domain-containing protein 29 [Amphibalanus amphitrite]